jgi:hypothetical protein
MAVLIYFTYSGTASDQQTKYLSLDYSSVASGDKERYLAGHTPSLKNTCALFYSFLFGLFLAIFVFATKFLSA